MITCLECGLELIGDSFSCPRCSKKYTISTPRVIVFYPDSNPVKKNGNGLEFFYTVTEPKTKKQTTGDAKDKFEVFIGTTYNSSKIFGCSIPHGEKIDQIIWSNDEFNDEYYVAKKHNVYGYGLYYFSENSKKLKPIIDEKLIFDFFNLKTESSNLRLEKMFYYDFYLCLELSLYGSPYCLLQINVGDRSSSIAYQINQKETKIHGRLLSISSDGTYIFSDGSFINENYAKTGNHLTNIIDSKRLIQSIGDWKKWQLWKEGKDNYWLYTYSLFSGDDFCLDEEKNNEILDTILYINFKEQYFIAQADLPSGRGKIVKISFDCLSIKEHRFMDQWKKTEPIASLDSFYDVDLKPAPNPPPLTIIPKSTIVPYPKDVSYDPQKRNLEMGYEYFTEIQKAKYYYDSKINTYYRINGGEKIKIHELNGYKPSFINIYKGKLYFCMNGSVYCYSNGTVSTIIDCVSPGGKSAEIKDMFCYRDLFVILVYVDNSDHSQYSPYLSSSEIDELHYNDSAFLATFTMDGKKVKELKAAHGPNSLYEVKPITSINQSGQITY